MKQDIKLHPVDELGAIRAQISDLRKRESELELQIKEVILRDAIDEPKLEGQIFMARLVPSIRETLIAEKVREFLLPQQLRHATRVTEVQSLRVTARKS